MNLGRLLRSWCAAVRALGMGRGRSAPSEASEPRASSISPNWAVTGMMGPMPMTKTASGLQYEDTTAGTGAEAKKGQTCVMHYTGWLWTNGKKGSKFDSSLDRNDPFTFELGAGEVIRGWDEGVAGIKVGGKRTLLIPPELGYGARGAGGVIPPNATLLFEVELLGLE